MILTKQSVCSQCKQKLINVDTNECMKKHHCIKFLEWAESMPLCEELPLPGDARMARDENLL